MFRVHREILSNLQCQCCDVQCERVFCRLRVTSIARWRCRACTATSCSGSLNCRPSSCLPSALTCVNTSGACWARCVISVPIPQYLPLYISHYLHLFSHTCVNCFLLFWFTSIYQVSIPVTLLQMLLLIFVFKLQQIFYIYKINNNNINILTCNFYGNILWITFILTNSVLHQFNWELHSDLVPSGHDLL